MHTYIHKYMNAYIHTYLHKLTYIQTDIHTYIRTYIRTHARTNTSKYREKELCGSAPYPALSQTDAMDRGCCGGLVELVELVDVGA